MNNKNIIIGVVVAGLVVAGGVFLYKKTKKSSESKSKSKEIYSLASKLKSNWVSRMTPTEWDEKFEESSINEKEFNTLKKFFSTYNESESKTLASFTQEEKNTLSNLLSRIKKSKGI